MGSCYSTEPIQEEQDSSIYRSSPMVNNNCERKIIIQEYTSTYNYQSPTKDGTNMEPIGWLAFLAAAENNSRR